MSAREFVPIKGPGAFFKNVWEGVPRASEGAPLSVPSGAGRSIQVFGEFDGATIVVEGSLEVAPVHYSPLRDEQGYVISLSGEGMERIAGVVHHTRWRVLGGGAKTNLTIIIMSRST